MNRTYVVNYNNWCKKGKRYSVFGRHIGSDVMELFTLTCSEQDNFSRPEAREVYEHYVKTGEIKEKENGEKYHPVISTIPYDIGETMGYVLNCYCRENYIRLWQQTIAIESQIKSVVINPHKNIITIKMYE